MRSVVLMIAGTLMVLSAAAHGMLGWPAMRQALLQTGAGADLVGALGAGWHFGTASMAAFGAIVIVSASRLRRGDPSGAVFVKAVAACYVIFGTATFVVRGYNPHFLLFVLTGVLAWLPVAALKSRLHPVRSEDQ
jgi:hypothetical protein